MAEFVRVIVQVRSTPSIAAAAFGPATAAPMLEISGLPGVEFDATFSPVPIPPRGAAETGIMATTFSASEPATHVMRAAISQDSLSRFLEAAHEDEGIVGVFADPRIEPIAVCPNGPVGTDLDVEGLLMVEELHRRGMDGAGVNVVIVDSGVNMAYLRQRGKNPGFDPTLSWGPVDGQPLGDMPVDHGTMCAYDVCIAAPACTLVDHALLSSQTTGGSVMDGYLSDALRSYGLLIGHMTKAPRPFAGDHTPRTLVVNNSWGMFHPSWDFPVGHDENYSDNPDHPFNIIVASLEAEGADILFAAGNCGTECPDPRCRMVTDAGIFGANSSPAVTCVAGVVTSNKERIGYSTKGPGRLEQNKPDIACFTHFSGSGVWAADGGTSAATPVAAGVVAAIRRLYPASVLSPARLRDLLRETAESPSGSGFDYEYGHGVMNVEALLGALEGLSAA